MLELGEKKQQFNLTDREKTSDNIENDSIAQYACCTSFVE